MKEALHYQRVDCNEMVALVVNDPFSVCLLHAGSGAGDSRRMISGSVHIDVTRLPNRTKLCADDLAAVVSLKDRVILRAREHCHLVLVYSSDPQEDAKHAISLVCKALRKDPTTQGLAYLTAYSEFAQRFATLLGGSSTPPTDDDDSSDSTFPHTSSASSSSSQGQDVCGVPSLEVRRCVAHKTVLARSLQQCPKGSPPTEVLPNVYVGGAHNAGDLEGLQARNVTLVVNVCSEVGVLFPQALAYTHVAVADEVACAGQLRDHFSTLTQQMHKTTEKGGVVFVHCLVGISRSCAVVAGMWGGYRKLLYVG